MIQVTVHLFDNILAFANIKIRAVKVNALITRYCIVWFMVIDGTCSLDPEGGRRIRKDIRRRRSRVGGSGKTRWTDRTKVICMYCRHDMSYQLSMSSLKYYLQAKHMADAESPPPSPKADITMFWYHLGSGDIFWAFYFLHNFKCWIKMFIKQAYLPNP